MQTYKVLQLTALAAALAATSQAYARDEANPEWPCVQRKVENLTPGQVWDGPPIKDVKGWWSDKPTLELINLLAARRTERKEAEKAIEEFIAIKDKGKRDETLTLVFAGLFDKVNATRRGVISGIERYYKAQEKRSLRIEEMGTELAELEEKSRADEAIEKEYEKAKEDFDWASRIFQERQANLPLACEVPVLIEQHLYQMAQLIRQQMEN